MRLFNRLNRPRPPLRAITQEPFVTEAAANAHLIRIHPKLGADNRAAAVSETVRRGALELR